MWYCWLQYVFIFWACPPLSTLHHYGSSGSFHCSWRHRKSQGGRGLLNRHLCPRNWDPTWWKIWDATLGKMDFLQDLPKNLTKVSWLVKLAMNLLVMLPWLYRGWFESLPSSLQNHSISSWDQFSPNRGTEQPTHWREGSGLISEWMVLYHDTSPKTINKALWNHHRGSFD